MQRREEREAIISKKIRNMIHGMLSSRISCVHTHLILTENEQKMLLAKKTPKCKISDAKKEPKILQKQINLYITIISNIIMVKYFSSYSIFFPQM